MITDEKLFALAEQAIDHATMQPKTEDAARGLIVGGILLCAFELRRIANTLKDAHNDAREDGR